MGTVITRILAGIGWVIVSLLLWAIPCNLLYSSILCCDNHGIHIPSEFIFVLNLVLPSGLLILPLLTAVLAIRGKLPLTGPRNSDAEAPHDRCVVPLLIAWVVAGVTLNVLLHGNRCLAPNIRFEGGEVGTAEMSVYGIALYRGTTTDTTMGVYREAMVIYREAVWRLKTALLVEWGVAAAVGVGVYLFARLFAWWWRGRARSLASGKHAEPGEAPDTGRK